MPTALPRPESCEEWCPPLVRETVDLITPKWAVPILVALHQAPLRYAALRRRLGAVTPKELTKHLRQLEAAGLVARRVHATVPPQVEYSLAARGRTLFPALDGLARWAAEFGDGAARAQTATPNTPAPADPRGDSPRQPP